METQSQTTLNENTILMDKTVRVVPIVREKGSILLGNNPKSHDGAFMYTGCKQGYCLPIDGKRRQLVSILTDEEQKFFEAKLHMQSGALSIYKEKKDNFWAKFYVQIDKEGMALKLNEPMDNLRWRVLKVVPQVAPSWEERFNSGEYLFALVDKEYEIKDEIKKADKLKDAYKFFGSIENSADKMRDFLKVYGKKPAENSKIDFLKSEISKLIDTDINGFLTLAKDKDFEMKLFIDRCLEIGALQKEGRTKITLPGGDVIGSTTDETIEFLRNKKNSDILGTLKAKIETNTTE